MPQLLVTIATMDRMKAIMGKIKVHDGDYLVNETIDKLEKKISDLS